MRYQVADLLDTPPQWRHAFNFVFESFTVQSLPPAIHEQAIDAVSRMVAPGGRLLVVAVHDEHDTVKPPPWPLTSAEIDAFTTDGLHAVHIEDVPGSTPESLPRWRAEFRRPAV